MTYTTLLLINELIIFIMYSKWDDEEVARAFDH